MAKIIMAEDDPMISEIYRRKFNDSGIEAIVVNNGVDLLKEIEKGGFDLALLDMILPGMSGLEIVKELKSGKYDKNLKIYMFSNYTGDEEKKEIMSFGVNGFLSKMDFTPSSLIKEIQNILGGSSSEKIVIDKKNEVDDGRKKILFIEDEDIFIELFGKKLEEFGHNVFYAKNGAWGAKEAIEKKYDLIIMDMVMPAMGGEEILGRIRNDEEAKNIPVIVFTASLDDEGLKEVKKMGIVDCFVKTRIVPSELLTRVNEILK